MPLEDGQELELLLLTGHRIAWFAPDRPVEGGTVFVRPTASDESANSIPPNAGDHD
jgi:hypothetical protein